MDTNNKEEATLFEEDSKDHLNSTFFNSERVSLNTSEMTDINIEMEKKEDIIYNDGKVYGASIKFEKPLRLGKVFAMLYYKRTPLIIIGPDCKIFRNPDRSPCIIPLHIG
jgi:hypothetical protein